MNARKFTLALFLAICLVGAASVYVPQSVQAQSCGLPGQPACPPSGGGGGKKKPTKTPPPPPPPKATSTPTSTATPTSTLTSTPTPTYLPDRKPTQCPPAWWNDPVRMARENCPPPPTCLSELTGQICTATPTLVPASLPNADGGGTGGINARALPAVQNPGPSSTSGTPGWLLPAVLIALLAGALIIVVRGLRPPNPNKPPNPNRPPGSPSDAADQFFKIEMGDGSDQFAKIEFGDGSVRPPGPPSDAASQFGKIEMGDGSVKPSGPGNKPPGPPDDGSGQFIKE